MTTAHPSPEPPASWRLSWDELAERTGATLERLERLVELGILAPEDAKGPLRSSDIHRVRAGAALEGSGVRPEPIAGAMAVGRAVVWLPRPAAPAGRFLEPVRPIETATFGRRRPCPW